MLLDASIDTSIHLYVTAQAFWLNSALKDIKFYHRFEVWVPIAIGRAGSRGAQSTTFGIARHNCTHTPQSHTARDYEHHAAHRPDEALSRI